jgi:formylglycine-generating enzyme required for sulfatase activity
MALGSLSFAIAQESKKDGIEKQITNSIGMKLTLIPAGEFKMGSGESAEATAAFFNKKYGNPSYVLKADYFADEHPQHRVRITQPFYLGTYHVTRGQFRQFVKDSAYKTDAEKGDNPGAWGWDPGKNQYAFNKDYSWRKVGREQTDEHPVVCVSWNDAVAFCKWLSGKEGKTYQLPSEAQWEYACRAGTKTRYYIGDDTEWWEASHVDAFTAPVGKFKPNAFGLYDMHNNASQWCADWHGANYYGKSPADDPKGPDAGDNRVLRGSLHVGPELMRSASRDKLAPGIRTDHAGFRVARSP